jgi:hypothetical protein
VAAKGALPADRERLNTIAERLRAGERYEDIIEDVDGVLGTKMPERDEDAEAEFEERKR